MECRKFVTKDFTELAAWGKSWGANYDQAQFPKTGFIVPGVAAYFLYSTDSKVCWLENLVSNPLVTRDQRDRALDLLTRALVQAAKTAGFTVAYACSNNGRVIQRAALMGARIKPNHVLLTLDLA